MHSAYSLGSLLKLPHAIQSMSAFGDFLLVGTKQGHLLMYLIKFNEPLHGKKFPFNIHKNYLRPNLYHIVPVSFQGLKLGQLF